LLIPALQPGDIVDIVAPASKCSVAELKAGVKRVEQLGLTARVPSGLFGKSVLFSNSDTKRLAQLKRAVFARDSRMIWCVRGGYGAIRLMPEILKWRTPRYPKIFLGYSDISTLHQHFNQKWGWPTLHGPLLDRFGRESTSEKETAELLGILGGRLRSVEFSGLVPMNAAARRARVIRGPVWGGNVAVLQSGLGTPGAISGRGGILFFEDTGERPHRMDRMLVHMVQAGVFLGCKAVVLGDFILKDPKDRRNLWNDVFARFASEIGIPVLKGIPAGHGPDLQRTVPFNTRAVLRLGARGASLVIDTGICG
jgi:muramoyltetrapeptide carboxypeptidase